MDFLAEGHACGAESATIQQSTPLTLVQRRRVQPAAKPAFCLASSCTLGSTLCNCCMAICMSGSTAWQMARLHAVCQLPTGLQLLQAAPIQT